MESTATAGNGKRDSFYGFSNPASTQALDHEAGGWRDYAESLEPHELRTLAGRLARRVLRKEASAGRDPGQRSWDLARVPEQRNAGSLTAEKAAEIVPTIAIGDHIGSCAELAAAIAGLAAMTALDEPLDFVAQMGPAMGLYAAIASRDQQQGTTAQWQAWWSEMSECFQLAYAVGDSSNDEATEASVATEGDTPWRSMLANDEMTDAWVAFISGIDAKAQRSITGRLARQVLRREEQAGRTPCSLTWELARLPDAWYSGWVGEAEARQALMRHIESYKIGERCADLANRVAQLAAAAVLGSAQDAAASIGPMVASYEMIRAQGDRKGARAQEQAWADAFSECFEIGWDICGCEPSGAAN